MAEIIASENLLTLYCIMSKYLSQRMYSFATSHHALTVVEEFHLLSQEEYLPFIDRRVAMQLVELEKRLWVKKKNMFQQKIRK
jgi:hypothetical protein